MSTQAARVHAVLITLATKIQWNQLELEPLEPQRWVLTFSCQRAKNKAARLPLMKE